MTTFFIPGKPFAKKRARSFYNKRLGRAMTVNPAENASFEGKVAAIALPLFAEPLSGPVSIEVTVTFTPAASWSRKRRQEAIGTYHTQKPDGDNILKAVKDGLNRVAWADDSQVAISLIRKLWGEAEGTAITVLPAMPEVSA
ncbi:Holliday junction resolvase RusA (prophage-encoded endonuclease) [Paracoccus pantotrophus]|nr:Holliday junction resolvase RusA (prophage-encoded endonuclease) [Paracoccus pantotrophus]